MRRLLLLLASSVSLLFCAPAFAWDGAIAGQILQFDVTGGNNYGVRVTLKGSPLICTGGQTWAYINESDSNYKVYVAMLMMAKTQGSQVTLYTNHVNGMCHIGYIVVA